MRADGGLDVRSPGRTDVVPAPGPPPPESSFWHVRSAAEAADRVLWVVDHLADGGRRDQVMHTLCAGLHPDVYPVYGRARQLRGIDDHPFLQLPCFEAVSLDVGGRNAGWRSSRHHGRSLRIRGGRAVLRTTIVHRYDADMEIPSRVVIPARILLIKDGEGVWRLASFRAIFANSVIHDSQRERYDDRSLEATYQFQRHRGARYQSGYDREQADLRAAQTVAGTAQPCAPAWHADPGGDVEVRANGQHTRQSREHLDVDLTAASFDGQCLAVRTAGALPAKFRVAMNVGEDGAGDSREYHVDVDRGQRTAVATYGTFDDRTVLVGQASLSDHELVVRFPTVIAQDPGPTSLWIDATSLGIGFVDALG
ncbi:MAG: hypothetical protein JHC95_10805 [Solirubrobacteraceae bacterium]|nr:hypothetical protein [Solirubrobacteraceae bacterium]